MKEADAKNTICPFATEFMMSRHTGAPHCLGSGCMAWTTHESAAFKSNAEYRYRQTGHRDRCDEGYCKRIGLREQDE